MINLKNILVELEFKTPADFAAYKKKHKMRPGTVVKVAGKDKVVGDDKIVYGTNFAGWDQPDKYDINKTTSTIKF